MKTLCLLLTTSLVIVSASTIPEDKNTTSASDPLGEIFWEDVILDSMGTPILKRDSNLSLEQYVKEFLNNQSSSYTSYLELIFEETKTLDASLSILQKCFTEWKSNKDALWMNYYTTPDRSHHIQFQAKDLANESKNLLTEVKSKDVESIHISLYVETNGLDRLSKTSNSTTTTTATTNNNTTTPSPTTVNLIALVLTFLFFSL